MKTINQYISEKLHINKDVKDHYNYHPKNKKELIKCIKEKIKKEGYGTKDKPLDLNDIDTSKITDMSSLFDTLDGELEDLSENGNFDISKWDVSKVKNMDYMFNNSNFDGDISAWDVSNVTNMEAMFCYSKFTGENGDISNWDVSNIENMLNMFFGSPLQNNPPKCYNDWYKKVFI